MVLVRYTPRLADLMPGAVREDAVLGPPAWSAYIRFDHTRSAAGNVDLRRALAHAIDREALAAVCPANLVVATGGVVPPALQGHTPDIALRSTPSWRASASPASGFDGTLELAGMTVWDDDPRGDRRSWRDVFGRVSVSSWSARGRGAVRGEPHRNARRSASPAGCPAIRTRSTTSGCSSSRRAGRTRAASPIRSSTS